MTGAPILPGTRVRTASGLVGTVERVEHQTGDEEPLALLVRAFDTEGYFRFPLRLVTGVHEEIEQTVAHTVVRLDLGEDELERYQLVGGANEPEIPGTSLNLPEPMHRLAIVAEQLTVETRPMQRGTVRLHKRVVSQEQALTVPVTREELIVERIPADEFDARAPREDGETIVPVVEERLVVETRRVITEYIRIRKRLVTESREVRGQVRREIVELSEQLREGAPQSDTPLLREL